jgi:peptidoglycan-N-acetylglucosamine deacetylase
MKTEDSAATDGSLALSSAHRRGKTRAARPITRIVTTSWDDGDPCDLRVAELLAARRLPGTFYIPVKGHVKSRHQYQRMATAEMLELSSQGFEIGGHGVSHPNLPECDRKQLMIEIEGCKQRLEDDLGKRISMFAYPRGRHNAKVIASLKRAGYTGARTTAMLAYELRFDPFRMPTSVHVFPHSRISYLRNLVRAWNIRRTWVYATHLRCASNWVEFAKLIFDAVMAKGGLWHLYGHSWEIEELQLWDGFKEVLDYVSNRPGVLYLANGAVVSLQATGSMAAEACPGSAVATPTESPGVERAGERQLRVYKESW